MFEWDEAKRRSVLLERGIDFADMTRVWDDPSALVGRDERRVYGEPRFRIIGEVHGIVFTVAFTHRISVAGFRTRIITAWKAHDNEREAYNRAKGKAV